MKKIIGLGNCLVDSLVKLADNSMLLQLGLPVGSMQLIDKREKEKIDEIITLYNCQENKTKRDYVMYFCDE